jgi:hypothetical protein
MGAGGLYQSVEMPTLLIPCACLCSWTVVRPGIGLACISQLKWANNICPVRHQSAAPAGIRRIGG